MFAADAAKGKVVRGPEAGRRARHTEPDGATVGQEQSACFSIRVRAYVEEASGAGPSRSRILRRR